MRVEEDSAIVQDALRGLLTPTTSLCAKQMSEACWRQDTFNVRVLIDTVSLLGVTNFSTSSTALETAHIRERAG